MAHGGCLGAFRSKSLFDGLVWLRLMPHARLGVRHFVLQGFRVREG